MPNMAGAKHSGRKLAVENVRNFGDAGPDFLHSWLGGMPAEA
jgi:hypothetical protein